MSEPSTTCDYCGAPDPKVIVDSPLGLATWNALHQDDQRTHLRYCDELCNHSGALTNAREGVLQEVRRQAEAAAARMRRGTC